MSLADRFISFLDFHIRLRPCFQVFLVEEADFKSDSDRRYFRFRQFMLIGGPFLTELSRGIFLNLQFGLIFSKKLY